VEEEVPEELDPDDDVPAYEPEELLGLFL